MFFGVPVSELAAIARTCYHGIGVRVSDNFLYYYFKSNRGHQTFSAQMEVGPDGKLHSLFGITHASIYEFLEKTSHLQFSKD